jgi:hypothetical protein
MNLLDKYILELGKHLPQRNRSDLQAEIRSTIEDMLDDKARQANRPVDDDMIEEVLKEYGSPANVADAYHPTRYLIGPQMYPFFLLVVKIVLAVLLAVTFAGFLWDYFNNPAGPAFLGSLGNFALQFFGGATAALGNIVLVFAILERVLPSGKLDESQDEWKPSDLLAEPDPGLVSRGETIFEILFTVLGLVVLNILPELIGLVTQGDSSWVYLPSLSAAFRSFLPWINLLGVLSVLLAVYLLRQGHWQVSTRIASLTIDIAGIVLAGIMLNGPSLVEFGVADLASTPVAGSAETLVQLVHLMPKIILAILIIVQSIEAVGLIRHLVIRQGAGTAIYNPSKE